MASDDSQFVATGGDSATKDGPNFGFYTDPSQDDDGAQLNYAVNVQGQVCGVYAESLTSPRSLGERQTPGGPIGEQVAVYAVGQHHGVIGDSTVREPVTGKLTGKTGVTGKSPGIGVQGTNTNNQIGVLGLNMQDGENFDTGSGIGVHGVSGTGIGVWGVIAKKIDPEIPLLNLHLSKIAGNKIGVQGESSEGFGVHGRSDDSDGVNGHSEGGDGVNGNSTLGNGVRGESDDARGGVFSSKSIAQVQLTPEPLVDPPTPLPREGMAGDLFSRLVVVSDQGGVLVVQAELWFCIQPTDLQPNDPILWAKVLLGTPVPPP